MAGGKKHQHQQQQGVVRAEPGVARRLWRVVRAVLYMLRRGVPSSGRKLAMDLHLLLHRGKIAGKALGDLLLHHGHGHHAAGAFSYAAAGSSSSSSSSSFSCRALDPGLAVHEPSRARREVEFSCSNTPSSAPGFRLLGAAKGRRRQRRDDGRRLQQQQQQQQQHCYYDYDAAEVARVFEMLSDDDGGDHGRLFVGGADDLEFEFEPAAPSATPSPARLLWALARSPAVAVAASAKGGSSSRSSRKTPPPRVADSPAWCAADEGVDRQADEFIRRFYEQLRAQRSAASTPDYYGHAAASAASPYTAASSGRTPRAVAAGIA